MQLPFFILIITIPTIFGANININNSIRVPRAAISYVWENGLVPYTFNPNFDNAQDRADWVTATKYIEQRTCLRFRERQDGDRYWLVVTKGNCCGSHGGRDIGARDKGQPITFGGGHIQPFYLHEIGHALAFPHEQDRPDRDEYIVWDEAKDPGKCKGKNFAGKVDSLDNAALETMFDYVSLMADWTECYWPRESVAPKDIPLGGGRTDNRTLSVLDIERLNAIYDCKSCYGYRFRNIKLLSTYQRPIEAGYELDGTSTFYICRVYHEGHLLIGKSRPDNQPRCWAAFDGVEREYRERFEVLTNPHQSNFRWQRRPDDFSIPGNAIKGGRTKDRETLYIARCLLTQGNSRTLIPGFVLQGNGREARVPYNGGTSRCQDFEYLICGQNLLLVLHYQ